eukprot:SAG11_NODE_13_length_26388_cov_67.360341_13_plen_229_part_00
MSARATGSVGSVAIDCARAARADQLPVKSKLTKTTQPRMMSRFGCVVQQRVVVRTSPSCRTFATKPAVKPTNPEFSSGPCKKRPGYSLASLVRTRFPVSFFNSHQQSGAHIKVACGFLGDVLAGCDRSRRPRWAARTAPSLARRASKRRSRTRSGSWGSRRTTTSELFRRPTQVATQPPRVGRASSLTSRRVQRSSSFQRPASQTCAGAYEMAMWSMLGERPVDMCYW